MLTLSYFCILPDVERVRNEQNKKIQIHVDGLAGAESVKSLALALQRDYKNVHHDVSVLESAGLLIRDGRKLSAPWDELSASGSLTVA